MLLVFAQPLVDGGVVVENLYLHAVIGGVDAHRGADADAVVDPFLHELEFETQDEIVVFLLGVEVSAAAVLRRDEDRAVDGDVVDGVAGPFVHRGSVEEHFEPFGGLLGRKFETRRGGQLADVHFAEADGFVARDQQDLPGRVCGNFTVAGVFENDVVARRDAVQHHRHTVVHHPYLHRVPLPGTVGRRGCRVVVEPVARQRTGVPASEGDLRDRADAEARFALGLPVDDQAEVFILLCRAQCASVRRSRKHAVCRAPGFGSSGVGLLLRFCQLFGLHRLADFGIAGDGFPAARGKGCRDESFGGEFRQQALDLVDGVTRVGVGFGQSGIDFLCLFQRCGDGLSAHVGIFRRCGLHDQRCGFGRGRVIHVACRQHQRGEGLGTGQRPEQFVLHLGRGIQFEGAAVELVFADGGVGGRRHEIRVARDRRIGPCGVLLCEVIQYVDHRGVLNRQQGREGGFAVGGGQQGRNGLLVGGLRQQGIVAGFFAGGGHPRHRLPISGGGRLFGQGVFQPGLQGFHISLLRLIHEVAQTVEIADGRHACQCIVCSGPHGGIGGFQQGEDLVGGLFETAFGDEFQGIGLRGGRAVEGRDEGGVGLAVEGGQGSRGLPGVRPAELGDEGLEGLLPADLARGADGCVGQLGVGRHDGGDDRSGLRGGMAVSEPADDIGFRRIVLQRREFSGDCGVEGVVGGLRGAIERRAAVGPVGILQRGQHLLRPFPCVRAQDDFQPCDPYVLRHAGFAQGLGSGEGFGIPCGGQPRQQVDIRPCGLASFKGVTGGFGRLRERCERRFAAALRQRVVDRLLRGLVGRGVRGPFQQRGFGGRESFVRCGIGQQGFRSGALFDQREDRPVGPGRGDKSAHGVVCQVFVCGVFHEYGDLVSRCAELQL